ncbi:MAG: GNAT family N-acetyltransferase [Dehalococcoidia bacterium]|nr:GNAT family N-acetyltransferase [Dehalococcoidia bacterium]
MESSFPQECRLELVGADDITAIARVIALGRRYRKTLGFLPDAAFSERAAEGGLIVARNGSGEIVGYVLFDRTRQHVAIRHLCVDTNWRQRGVAALLVDRVARDNADRQGVAVSCRRDYGLDDMWRALGFIPLAERPGRGASAAVLTRWWMPLSGAPTTLFDWSRTATLTAALDTDVLVDLHTDRAPGAPTRLALAGWIHDELELVVGPEVLNELNGVEPSAERRRLRDAALSYRQLRVDKSEIEHIAREICTRMKQSGQPPPADGDLQQIAAAAAARVDAFFTRDRRLRRAVAPLLRGLYGVRVLAPVDATAFIDEHRRAHEYVPAALMRTEIRQRRAKAGELWEMVDRLLQHTLGETHSQYTARCTDSQGGGVRIWVIETQNGEVVAVYSDSVNQGSVDVQWFRITRTPLSTTIARHLSWHLRVMAVDSGLDRVNIHDSQLPKLVTDALEAEGYAREGSVWVARCPKLIASDVEHATRVLGRRHHESGENFVGPEIEPKALAIAIADLEHRFWPMKVVAGELPTYLIPIRAGYAQTLFDTAMNERTLFERPHRLGLASDHVYYRAPTLKRMLQAPGRILWYVGKDRRWPESGAVRGWSMLEEVVCGDPDALFTRFSRFGVLDRQAVWKLTRDGQVMALRFSRTSVLPRPVSFSELRRIMHSHGSGLVLQSPSAVKVGAFVDIYREAFE